jgi:hypothetical protein
MAVKTLSEPRRRLPNALALALAADSSMRGVEEFSEDKQSDHCAAVRTARQAGPRAPRDPAPIL